MLFCSTKIFLNKILFNLYYIGHHNHRNDHGNQQNFGLNNQNPNNVNANYQNPNYNSNMKDDPNSNKTNNN